MKTKARLHKPPKTATQSGLAKTKQWLMEFPYHATYVEPLMGWVGAKTTVYQKKLWFNTKEEAVTYLATHAIPYEEVLPSVSTPRPKSYGDHFKAGRVLK